jgi:hypothetical protein
MPVDIALHPLGTPVHGNHPDAQVAPAIQHQVALADATPSADFVVPKPGAKLVLVATAKLRVDIRLTADAAVLNAGTSAMVLGANERVSFFLTPGSYRLLTAVYA